MKNKKEPKIVTTINGENIIVNKTKKIDDQYYKIGNPKVINSGDCYKINNVFVKASDPHLFYNYSDKEYFIKSTSLPIDLTFGVVEISSEGNITKGYFKNTDQIDFLYERNGLFLSVFKEIDLRNNRFYRESLADGIYYHILTKPASFFSTKAIITQNLKESFPYSLKNSKEASLKYQKLFDSEVEKKNEFFNNFLFDKTFGIEFETTEGIIPEKLTNKLGIVPLRDGSIPGLEYVTIPLNGAKGLQTIQEICKVLKDRTSFNHDCSLHIHIGNVERTPAFLTAYFITTLALQDQIFSLFEFFKKECYGVKKKNYCKPYNVFDFMSVLKPGFNNIDKNFEVIVDYLAETPGYYSLGCSSQIKNLVHHPKDPDNNQKWKIKHRYHSINLIPIIFGNKKTIEYRLHSMTYDFEKIIYFLLLNTLIIKFVEENQNDILNDFDFLNIFQESKGSFFLKTLLLRLSVFNNKLNKENINFIDSFIRYFRNRQDLFYNNICKNKGLDVHQENDVKKPHFNLFNNKKTDSLEFIPTPILDSEIIQKLKEKMDEHVAKFKTPSGFGLSYANNTAFYETIDLNNFDEK